MAKRWTIPFKSLNGTSCHVDIYDSGWSGSVTTIKGAPDPFEYEEDMSDDLLTVVRTKTGYLRVVEETYGALDALYPTSEKSRYVEFYYGSRLDFVGYLQAQSFEKDWTATPRVLQFPVQSPLAMLGGMYFSKVNPPADRTLGVLMAEVVEKLSFGDDYIYSSVIFPDTSPSFDSKISSLIISPFNGDFEEIGGTSADLFDPIDMKTFMEGVCNAFGWMLHEDGRTLIFTRYDYDGAYARSDVDYLATPSRKSVITAYNGGSIYNLADYYTLASDDHKHTIDRPVSSVEWRYDGKVIQQCSMKDLHAAIDGSSTMFYGGVATWLKPVSTEFGGSRLREANTIDAGLLVYTGVNLCYAGAGRENDDEGNQLASISKRFLICKKDDVWAENTELFYVTFFEHPMDMCKLKISMSWGSRVEYLGNSTGDDEITDNYRYRFSLVIQCNGKYFNNDGSNDPWQSSTAYVDFDVPLMNRSGEMIIRNIPRRGALKISFRWAAQPGPYGMDWSKVVSIDDIQLTKIEFVLDQYTNPGVKNDRIKKNTGSPEAASISLPMNCYKDCNCMIGDSWYARKFTEYDYLFSPRNILNLDMKQKSRPSQFYISKWRYWISSWRWRITAVGFSPWNDIYQIKIHQSPTI